MTWEKTGFSTKAVHGGEKLEKGSVATPIYETSVFAFTSTKELINVISEKTEGYLYTRFDNPTVRAVERKIAVLEGSEDAAAFSSGMAAITTTLLTLVSKGDHVVASRDLYGGTLTFLQELLPRFDIEINLVDTANLNQVKEAIKKNTRVVYAEIPTNPTLKIVDLSRLAALAKKHSITTVIDSTLATPYNLTPIKFGIDVVVHSATKYLGGHNDVTAGIVCGSREFIQKLKKTRKILGGTLDPMAAWLLLRGLKTLALRMERHNRNGMQIAQFLEKHPKIAKVYYPGLPSHPQHRLAKKQMRGYGGVVSFEIKGDFEKTVQFVENLKLCLLAASLGGTETLATQPTTSSHYFITPEQRQKLGITDQLVRLALGIEDPEDIIADLKQSLEKI
ncbi:MAG: aminotransferase class I/II-fold pyridoxal phosphate-dependent enzyme [Candidatus Bathyarchaeota archaeon]|jgi:cystathionine beta-lyase/cystathionine gamma-synthase|nr:aminotransferase class I/II-fold pyridoxal phosphate-dependent enzyme [Candidatus Bathyarchaeota archaeon A05DMB-3]MDH7606694.1 aminotransferase class I/II-fold pyridoxal phosphate-dependent enzyme [Candidatus Bathyarchaeota archaeon]